MRSANTSNYGLRYAFLVRNACTAVNSIYVAIVWYRVQTYWYGIRRNSVFVSALRMLNIG